MKKIILSTVFFFSLTMNALASDTCQTPLTKAEIKRAQQAWAENIINIGRDAHPKSKALETLNTLYAYDAGEVLFKPTLAAHDQFRLNKDEALSYFVGGGNKEDQGFALRGFTDVQFDNEQIITHCDIGMAMGNYYFRTKEGDKLKVEYSFGYRKMPDKTVKIILHHSSLPYQPTT
jgi:hypothetical protein